MSMAAGRYIALALVFMQNAIAPRVAHAQGTFQVTPLFGINQSYDSNLFFTSSGRQADFITRVSPGVQSEYRSPLFTLLGRYVLDGERFVDHPELTTMAARQRADVDVSYRPTRRLAIAADAELLKTQMPSELNSITNLALTRASAQQVSAHSSITRQLDMVTSGTIDYRFTQDHIAGGFQMRSHAARLGADRHPSLRDTVSVNYRFQEFSFETFSTTSDALSSRTTSHALGMGWARAISRRASFAIDGGARVTNGSPASDVSASVRYQLKSSDWSLVYARTQTTVIGLAAIADTQSLAATAAWHARPSLQMRVAPAVYRSAQSARRADVYQLAFDVERQIVNGLSLDVAVNAYLQRGNLYVAFPDERIPRQTVTIKLVAAPAAKRR
jgi:hypothetical protein